MQHEIIIDAQSSAFVDLLTDYGVSFKALATTSSGFAWSRGHADYGVTCDMVLAHLREMALADIAALGVRRVRVGGALARAAWAGFMRAATLLAEESRFDGLADAASGQVLNGFFREGLKRPERG